MEAGLAAGDAENVVVAVAPIVGARRSASAAAKILEGPYLVIDALALPRTAAAARLGGPGTALTS